MPKLRQITIHEIRLWRPCYDPSLALPEKWKGTALDLLEVDSIPFLDRMWAILRPSILGNEYLTQLVLWCGDKQKPSITPRDMALQSIRNLGRKTALLAMSQTLAKSKRLSPQDSMFFAHRLNKILDYNIDAPYFDRVKQKVESLLKSYGERNDTAYLSTANQNLLLLEKEKQIFWA